MYLTEVKRVTAITHQILHPGIPIGRLMLVALITVQTHFSAMFEISTLILVVIVSTSSHLLMAPVKYSHSNSNPICSAATMFSSCATVTKESPLGDYTLDQPVAPSPSL